MSIRPVITTSEGKIQGVTLKSILGKNYLAFRGIPYAKPPVGDLRFREPQPPEKWSGIRDASNFAGTIPTQKVTDGQPPFKVIGGEDCLYLNVYTNVVGQKRPVMFYIYGGVFLEGNGNTLYREDYFVNSDVVLVFVNYRLGPLGFLSVGHEVASGNQGLRDVMFALQWVQRNIEAFGGDPNNVTIFGNSAGSVISHLLTVIPSTKHLFKRAILQSGPKVKNLITGKDPKNGFRIASLLGMESDNPVEVIEFLRSVPAEKLVALEDYILSKWEKIVLRNLIYEPVVDSNSTKNPVIPSPLKDLIKNDADVPIIIGNTANEGLLTFMGKFDNEYDYKLYNENIEDIVRNELLLKDSSKFPEIMKVTREFYLKNQSIKKENVWNLVSLISDLKFLNINRKIIDTRNEYATAPTFVYKFSYLGHQPTVYQHDRGPQPLKGVAHADELSYMFYFDYMRKSYAENDKCPPEGTKDRLVIERMIRMWCNFATTGDPTPAVDDKFITTVWKTSSKKNLHYLEISDELTLKDDKNSEYREIYDQFKNDLFFGI